MAGYTNPAPVGEMDSTTLNAAGTLDEPVKETIARDLRSVGVKMLYVLLPRSRHEKGGGLRQWDLWGPLFLCLTLSVVLWAQSHFDQLVFGLVFILTWAGSSLVTANGALLGGKISFFQGVCVLGYCLAPIVIASLLCFAIPSKVAWIKAILLAVALYFSSGASVGFMSDVVSSDRKALAVYPVWLFYAAMSSIILLV